MESELFKGTNKKRHHEKQYILNAILCNWYGKCTSSNIYNGDCKKDWVKKS